MPRTRGMGCSINKSLRENHIMRKITINTLTMRLLLLYPIFTTLDFIPAANIVLAVLTMALIAVSAFGKGITKTSFVLICASLLTTIVNLLITNERVIRSNEIIYLAYMCVFFAMMRDSKKQVQEYLISDASYIFWVCVLWSALVLFSMLLPTAYIGGVFVSFSGDTFRLSPSALYIMSLTTLLVVIKGKRYVLLAIVPLLAVLLGASRTYLLICALCFAINLYFMTSKKANFVIALGVAALLGVLVVVNSSMGEKILDSFREVSYLTPAQVFTNGRSNFWVITLQAFWEQPIFNRLVGCGYNFVRVVNGAIIGTGEDGIWAHNDFIQVLATNGLFGLIIYICAMSVLFRTYMKESMPKTLKLVLVFIWFFNAFFNMYYVYICAMVSLPVLLLASELGCEARRQKNQIDSNKRLA